MIPRPSKVPRAARYSARDGWWQVGEVVDGKAFGPWKTYRADGSPLFEARFDSKGRLQGAFKRFHPDGTLAREARYARGKLTKLVLCRAKGPTDDIFPSSDPRASRLVFDFEDGNATGRTALDDRGRPLADDRTIPATSALGVLDPVFAGAKPDGFLASGVLPRVVSTFDVAPSQIDDFLLPCTAQPRRPLDAKRFQDLYGVPMPPALRAWNDAFANEPALLGMRVTRDADLVVEGNVIEALIREHQEAPCRSDGLFALVSGLIPIGTSSDGRLRYCASICEAPEAPTDAVYPLNLSDEAIQLPVARTLDDFAYAVALATAASRGSVSAPGLGAAYERLRGRVDLRAPMTEIEAALDEDMLGEDITGDVAGDHAEGFHFRRPNSAPTYFFYRNRWLLRLLAGNPEGAAAVFDANYAALDDTRFERVLKNLDQPWVTFYWAFHCLIFADARLDKLLAVASDVPSQLSREIAALVRELADGRRTLGLIDDFEMAKDVFHEHVANKPDEEDDEDEDEGDHGTTSAIPSRSEVEPDDDDIDAAVALLGVDDDGTAKVCADAAARGASAKPGALAIPPELAAEGAVIAWAQAEGYSRENLLLEHELEAAALGLALRGDPKILRVISTLFDDDPSLGWTLLAPWLESDRGDLAALAPTARDWLNDRDDGAVYRWMAGASVLARAGKPSDAKRIADVLEPSLDQMFGRGLGFEAAMGMMVLGEAIEVLCAAVTMLGISETVIAALEGVANADTHLVDDQRGPCSLALASVHRGLDAVLAGVRGQIERDHRARITDGQLHALGILGAHEPERRAEVLAVLKMTSVIDGELGYQCAMFDLGAGGDIASIIRRHLEPRKIDDDDSLSKRRALTLETVARRRDVPAELALPFVGAEDIPLHLAAIRTLRARGVAVPSEIAMFDPLFVEQLAAKGRNHLHAALVEGRGTYLGNLALWLGDHPDPSSREPLATFARALAARELPNHGPRAYDLRWTIRALVRTGGSDAVLDELLRHPHEHVGEQVLAYLDQLGPAVARGMVDRYQRDDSKPVRQWLLKYKNDPRVAAALAEHGLGIGDLTRKIED
ncbi:MAG: hypothetical protein H0V17_13105 [Deltaproteobacteria bacterium]|nr:hypothetical protein [Deltaproteobacteria bacterium]